jgi:AraC family transcriptional regulator of adaptative response / DNA-3-methyladenine glycosylase II
MRALGNPDVYLPTDLGVRRAMPDATPEHWAPWRSYAVMHLWAQTKEVAA